MKPYGRATGRVRSLVLLAVIFAVLGCEETSPLDGGGPSMDGGRRDGGASVMDSGRADDAGSSPRDGARVDGGGCVVGPEDTPEACSDGCSNDGDPWTDCEDWDCGHVSPCAADAGPCTAGPEDTVDACTDGCSNDGDPWIDCEDWDCGGTGICAADGGACRLTPEHTLEACADGCSNDGDPWIDCDDWDCAGIGGCPARDGGTVPTPDAGSCVPDCSGGRCGSDGCGGSCPPCPSGQICGASETCVPDCTPLCPFGGCGRPDGCGGTCGCPGDYTCSGGSCIPSCCASLGGACGTCSASGTHCPGTCPAGQYCSGGSCRSSCVPDCTDRYCGDDGCGGVCGAGTCPTGAVCGSDGRCYCDQSNEWFPNRTRTACVRGGGPCGDVTATGHCVGDYWVFCDPAGGGRIRYLNCPAVGSPGCRTVSATSGEGACDCGALSADGVCMGESREYHIWCLDGYNIAVQDSCRQYGPSGFCSTFVGAYGHQTSCFCSACQMWDYGSASCRRPCSACTYNASSNIHFCP